MLAHASQKSRDFPSRLQSLAQERRTQIAHDHVPGTLNVLFGIVRSFAGDALAPSFQPITIERNQQHATVVGTAEASLKKMDQRHLDFAKSDGFNFHLCLYESETL